MRWVFWVLAFLLPHSLFAQVEPSASTRATQLEKGKILPRVQCAAHPDQTYALYLPSNYSPDHQWPFILSSDPGARGSVPLELQKDVAEKMGYVLAASNNSRNGPGKARFEATAATLTDVQQRVAIDTRRIYFAGFSGGARFSSQVALACNCAAGVLLSGAGFSNGQPPATGTNFPVFLAVGILDFNYSEVVPLQGGLVRAGFPNWLRVFDGSHEWAPAGVMAEALAWFRIEAMKAGSEPRDPAFLDAEFAKMQAGANSFEQSEDILWAFREYSQIASTFAGLKDIEPLRAKAAALNDQKALNEALKREHNEFAEQAQLTERITSRFDPSKEDADRHFEANSGVHDLVTRLRTNAQQEKRPEKCRVYKRALGGVFIGAIEAGNGALEQKRYAPAIRLYEIATLAKPDSAWAWEQLAIANALAGKKKDALNALRKARDLATDKAAFGKWLQSESSFEILRSSAEFRSLL